MIEDQTPASSVPPSAFVAPKLQINKANRLRIVFVGGKCNNHAATVAKSVFIKVDFVLGKPVRTEVFEFGARSYAYACAYHSQKCSSEETVDQHRANTCYNGREGHAQFHAAGRAASFCAAYRRTSSNPARIQLSKG